MGNKNKELIENHSSQSESAHSELSKEHSQLSKEHSLLLERTSAIDDISKVSNTALREIQDTRHTVSSIHKEAVAEKAKQQQQYENLNEKQRDITALVTNSVDGIKQMTSELLRLNTAYIELQGNYEAVIHSRETLKGDYQNLKQDYRQAVLRIKQLEQDIVRMHNRPTREFDGGYDFEP